MTPQYRIVSLVPSLTETLCDLGLTKSIIGCTSFCISPREITKSATIIGGTKNPDIAQILSLNPTHIVVNKEENTLGDIQKFETLASSKHFYLINTYPKTLEDSISLIKNLGDLFAKETEASTWIKTISKEYITLKQSEKLTSQFLYFIWRNPWMVAGNQTYISQLLSLIGLNNLILTTEELEKRYPIFDCSAQHAILMQADILLFSSEPFPFRQRHITEFLETSGRPQCRTLLVDGQNLSWYGTRSLKALQYLLRLQERILNLERS